LLDSDQARLLVEGAEERGYLEAAELEAFALEHELNDEDVEELTRELERIGLEIRPKPSRRRPRRRRPRLPLPPQRPTSSPVPPTHSSSSSPTSAATSC
jgi:hypothetical protein